MRLRFKNGTQGFRAQEISVAKQLTSVKSVRISYGNSGAVSRPESLCGVVISMNFTNSNPLGIERSAFPTRLKSHFPGQRSLERVFEPAPTRLSFGDHL